ncbi:hypothetical protein CRG98_009363 [Punica granatum]|uniref:Uncharacterized protein n=1 Tax=Punica granatum TaxID=22663 RepID=A0A2I0KP14_PUNGR|nr:hypothetical protein CRG98_009363 [Punica granatum]
MHARKIGSSIVSLGSSPSPNSEARVPRLESPHDHRSSGTSPARTSKSPPPPVVVRLRQRATAQPSFPEAQPVVSSRPAHVRALSRPARAGPAVQPSAQPPSPRSCLMDMM